MSEHELELRLRDGRPRAGRRRARVRPRRPSAPPLAEPRALAGRDRGSRCARGRSRRAVGDLGARRPVRRRRGARARAGPIRRRAGVRRSAACNWRKRRRPSPSRSGPSPRSARRMPPTCGTTSSAGWSASRTTTGEPGSRSGRWPTSSARAAVVPSSGTAEEVTVGGLRALWIAGTARGTFTVIGADLAVHKELFDVAAGALLWQDDGVAFLLQGAGTKEDAARLAAAATPR